MHLEHYCSATVDAAFRLLSPCDIGLCGVLDHICKWQIWAASVSQMRMASVQPAGAGHPHLQLANPGHAI
jgi:hypothetical protein